MPASRRLAAIMFTDVVGYSAAAQADEAGALRLLEEQEELVRPVLATHGGREIKSTGDGFLVEFDSALRAVQCAIDVHQHLHERNLQKGVKPIELRVGIHLGDVEERAGDIFGDAVNIASRIEPLAEPGGLCVSEQVFAQVRNKLSNHFVKLAPTRLKNIQFPVEVYRVVLPWEEPGGTVVGGPRLDGSRIVVLPFINLTPDPADSYFADGLTEELIGAISRIQQLSVISRTSAMKFKGASKTVREIGTELGAGSVLEGSVRKVGNTVRISAQLIDVNDDKHLWSENYDRTLANVFAVQSDVAEHVATALRSELTSGARARLRKGPTRDTAAYLLYLRGRVAMRSPDPAYREAFGLFEEALAKDADCAPAYAALSECYTYVAGEVTPVAEGFASAMRCARRAIELDDGLSEAHASLGLLLLQRDFDVKGATQELRRAIELNPSNSMAHQWLAPCLRIRGQLREGMAEATQAEKLDPLSSSAKWFVGLALFRSRDFEAATEKLQESLALEPAGMYPHVVLAYIRAIRSDFAGAVVEAEKCMEASKGRPPGLEALGWTYALAGRKDEAHDILEQLTQFDRRGIHTTASRGLIQLCLGEREEAIRLLQTAYEEHDLGVLTLLQNPFLDPIRDDPRIAALADRLGFVAPPGTGSND